MKVANYGWIEVKDYAMLENIKHDSIGNRHCPIQHKYALEFFKNTLMENGIKITKERCILSPESEHFTMIFLADTEPLDGKAHEDFNFSVGFLNNNERKIAFTGIAGQNCYANSSTHLVSEDKFKAKHCTNVNDYLTERVANIINWYKEYYNIQTHRIDAMKATSCDDKIVAEVVLNYLRKPYALSNTNIGKIVKSWDKPEYEAFKERNVWSFFNTTQEVFKRVKSPMLRLNAMEVFDEVIDKHIGFDKENFKSEIEETPIVENEEPSNEEIAEIIKENHEKNENSLFGNFAEMIESKMIAE